MYTRNQIVLCDNPTSNHTSQRRQYVSTCVEFFRKLLKEIKASRVAKGSDELDTKEMKYTRENGTVLDEVVEVITLPSFNSKKASKKQRDPSSIQLDEDVERELYEFVSVIASRYPENVSCGFLNAKTVGR